MTVAPIKRIDLEAAAVMQVTADVLWTIRLGRLNVKYFRRVGLKLFYERVVIQ
jgi:hypothetical protein